MTSFDELSHMGYAMAAVRGMTVDLDGRAACLLWLESLKQRPEPFPHYSSTALTEEVARTRAVVQKLVAACKEALSCNSNHSYGLRLQVTAQVEAAVMEAESL